MAALDPDDSPAAHLVRAVILAPTSPDSARDAVEPAGAVPVGSVAP